MGLPRLLATSPLCLNLALLTVSFAEDLAGSEPVSCFGKAPTIVGTPEGSVEGTAGPDVVVTNGAELIETLEGDDWVCLTRASSEGANIQTGDGDDRITTVPGQEGSSISIAPGAGNDEVVGGPATESVEAGSAVEASRESDSISTGSGRDWVYYPGAGDVVNLGPGRDSLIVEGATADADLFGGLGNDRFLVAGEEGPSSYWVFDNRRGEATRDGTGFAHWRSFYYFRLDVRGPVEFKGSNHDELLHARFARRSLVDASMRGGADTVTAHRAADGSKFDGGQGRDTFSNGYEITRPDRSLVLDLASGFFEVARRALTSVAQVLRFENAAVSMDGPVILKGTSGPNVLSGYTTEYGLAPPVTIDGRAGEDRLRGGLGNDVLIGGPGADFADGRAGSDRCQAETAHSCERQRAHSVAARITDQRSQDPKILTPPQLR